MTDNTKREIRWPDGWSASIPLRPFPVGIGGTYYSKPGSPTAPRVTAALTYTWTPQQTADFLTNYGLASLDLLKRAPAIGPLGPVTPAMGPEDELSPFARTLQSGVGTVGAPSAPPIRYLSSRGQNPVGNEMGDWRASAGPIDTQGPTAPAAPQEPGGLLGLIRENMRNNAVSGR